MITFPLKIAQKQKSYILKLNPKDKNTLIQNKHKCLKLAQKCGIKTNCSKIVFDKKNNAGLLIERFDRRYRDSHSHVKIHQEDACQFLDRYPADKYRLSLKEICQGIQNLATAPLIEILKLIELYIFSYLIGNGDLHAKNISLQTDDKTKRVQLTPAYDLICTFLYNDQHMALKMDGRDDQFKRRHFVDFAKRFDINEKSVNKVINDLLNLLEKNKELLVETSFLTIKDSRKLQSMIDRRMGGIS